MQHLARSANQPFLRPLDFGLETISGLRILNKDFTRLLLSPFFLVELRKALLAGWSRTSLLYLFSFFFFASFRKIRNCVQTRTYLMTTIMIMMSWENHAHSSHLSFRSGKSVFGYNILYHSRCLSPKRTNRRFQCKSNHKLGHTLDWLQRFSSLRGCFDKYPWCWNNILLKKKYRFLRKLRDHPMKNQSVFHVETRTQNSNFEHRK